MHARAETPSAAIGAVASRQEKSHPVRQDMGVASDQRRSAMTLSERLDRALAWLLFDFDPTPWAERHPWLAVGALLLALAVVGHWDVM